MSFKSRGKNKPLSKVPKENKEFETIILDNNERSPAENS